MLPRLPSQTRPACDLPSLGISAAGLWPGPRQEKTGPEGRWAGGARAQEAAQKELEAPLPSSKGSGFWLAGGKQGGKRTQGRGRERLHQWLPEQLPREKSVSLWRQLLPLVPGALGREWEVGREGWSQGSWYPGQRAGDSTQQQSQPIPGQPGAQGARKAPWKGQCLLWSRNREKPSALLLPVSSGLLAPNPHLALPWSPVLRRAHGSALCSTLPNPRDTSSCLDTSHRWALAFQKPAHRRGRVKVFGRHSRAFCLSSPHSHSDLC